MALLKIENLTVKFQTEAAVTTAVQNISFSVDRGEIVAIVGESGSGKSVTALSILQLLPSPSAVDDGGKILFSESEGSQLDLLKLPEQKLRSLRGSRISMIFQEPMTSLNPVFTCGDQVMEAIRLHEKINRQEAISRTISLFEQVGLPDPSRIFYRYPHELSGGQKQRVMISMAMSCRPSLLICDEPTTALDVTVQKNILQLIRDLQQSTGMGVIFITHDLGVVAEIADRAVVMYKGEIVEQGSTNSLFTAPGHPYTKALLACRPILHEKGERLPTVSDFMRTAESQLPDDIRVPHPDKTVPKPADARVSRTQNIPPIENPSSTNSDPLISTNNDPLTSTNSDPLISVEELSVWFPASRSFFGRPKNYIKAVDGVSFSVFKGETLGLVGESGCGKTTLGRTLLRLINPTSGTIMYNGSDLTLVKGQDLRKFRKEFQIVFQDPYSSLNPRMTIGEAIAEPLQVHSALNRQQRREKVQGLLEKVSLRPEHFNRYPHEFSGGQRQRIVIARALALDPSFVVCDESVSALDVSVQAQVLNLLNDLKNEFGFTVIFISHDLSVVNYVSDRIMVMNKGKIEEIGPATQVFHHPKSDYTRRLIDAIPK